MATNLVPATPTEQVMPCSSKTRARRYSPICGGVAEPAAGAGDVEEGLVHRQRLDQRRDRPEERHDRAGDLGVERQVPRQHRGGRAQPQRAGGGHGGVHPVPARLVGGRGDHAPVAVPADDHRRAGQLRVAGAPPRWRRRRPCPRAARSTPPPARPPARPPLSLEHVFEERMSSPGPPWQDAPGAARRRRASGGGRRTRPRPAAPGVPRSAPAGTTSAAPPRAAATSASTRATSSATAAAGTRRSRGRRCPGPRGWRRGRAGGPRPGRRPATAA